MERDRGDEIVPSSESARIRRRERERTAKDRELMRTGQAKAFKQILDAQAKRAAGIDRRRVAEADVDARPGQGTRGSGLKRGAAEEHDPKRACGTRRLPAEQRERPGAPGSRRVPAQQHDRNRASRTGPVPASPEDRRRAPRAESRPPDDADRGARPAVPEGPGDPDPPTR